jgi:hypothetical protein
VRKQALVISAEISRQEEQQGHKADAEVWRIPLGSKKEETIWLNWSK